MTLNQEIKSFQIIESDKTEDRQHQKENGWIDVSKKPYEIRTGCQLQAQKKH
jgi:hypothetical protein